MKTADILLCFFQMKPGVFIKTSNLASNHLFSRFYLEAIQIILDTFLAYFRPPPLPHVAFGDIGTAPPPVWRDIFIFWKSNLFRSLILYEDQAQPEMA